MKRIVSLVLALSMVLSMFSFAFAGTTPKDVVGTNCEAAVSALVELGIVSGYEDGTYKPEKVVTRAELAKLLVISAGLEKAADVQKGTTTYSDVGADHWASGYINVASQYGYINGYPDGTFQPNATVKYSEAVTMAIRVLGYKSVVESKGTWPTNYIAKAQELKTLDGVTYDTYNDGATRGNVAILIWNMLTTEMWDITSENETNGLNYSNNGITMIDKYFEDYDYIDEDKELVVTGIEVEDGKVTVTVESEDTNPVDYELAEGTDFLYSFGRTVSILYNKKDKEAVMLIPSTKDKVVEGYTYDLDDDGYTLSGDRLVWGDEAAAENAYVSGVIDTKKVTKAYTVFATTPANTTIVKEIKVNSKTEATTVKALDGTTWKTIDEDAIVLIDGKWAKGSDLKANDVVTELVAGELYIVSRNIVEGSFDEVAVEEDIEELRYYVKVDGEEYSNVLTDVAVEIDEDGEDKTETPLGAIMDAKKDDDNFKFYDEDCSIYLNFIDEVVRIEFEEIEDLENEGNFYVLTNKKATWTASDKKGETTYVELNGETYEVKDSVDVSALTGEGAEGGVVFVKFDSRDRVKEITLVGNESGAANDKTTDDKYEFVYITSGDVGEDELLDDKDYIVTDNVQIKVNSKTTVITIKGVEDEDDEDVIDHYEYTISKGPDALEGVDAAIVAVDTEDEAVITKAAYVFVWEDAKNTDKTIGLVDSYKFTKGILSLTIDGKSYEVDDELEIDTDTIVNTLLAFVENEGKITKIAKAYTTAELPNAAHVTEVDGRELGFEDGSAVDLDAVEDDYEDFRVIVATVEEDTKSDEYAVNFSDWEETTYKDVKVKKGDAIAVTKDTDSVDIILVIRGIDWDSLGD